ncbi:hypothetical protein BH09PLA1_BH09PLA1_26580 [soil metagenome]
MDFRHSNPLFRLIGLTLLALAAGCNFDAGSGGSGPVAANSGVRLQRVNLNELSTAAPGQGPIVLAAAKNEWTSFVVQINGLQGQWGKRAITLRVLPLRMPPSDARISPASVTAFQVLSMPVDGSRAGYVRHTGLQASTRSLPRALLPLKSQNGVIDLTAARDPARPLDPQSRASGASDPLMLWLDVHIPPEARAGDYLANCEVIESGSKRALATVPIKLTVHDFVLPDDRHLMMVGAVEWDDLTRLCPDRFEAVTPRLMSRAGKPYEAAIQTLDQLVDLAQRNRVQVTIPRLQPTVKWPPGKPPQVDWNEFDSLVAPWLKGDTFPDKTPFGYWPLPEIDNLKNFDAKSQREYWEQAAKHFDESDWLTRSSVVLRTASNRRADSTEALKLSSDAADILSLNPRLRVEVPLEDDQVQFASPANDKLIRTDSANRLITSNPGLVFSSPIRLWPDGVERPARWLRTDRTDLSSYVGAGADERDVRLWAWFASVPLPPPAWGVKYGPVQFIRWPGTLPRESKPSEPADPNELAWFYPGSWFGIDQPVPTIQLKWLRRAQQDFEYLYLARQRGETINALVIARLMSKPVELQPNQALDPTFTLMSGTADADAWNEALRLVAQRILLREPGQSLDADKDRLLNLELNRWAEPQERPVAMGRTVTWSLEDFTQVLSPLAVRLGIDIYNAADRSPFGNSLQFASVPAGWMHSPRPITVDELGTYHVQRFALGGQIEPTQLRNTDRKPVEITFTDGFTKKQSNVRMVIPAAMCDRRAPGLKLDGSLDDWMSDDAIQDGPLVRMFNRPALQKQELQFASTPASLYCGWADLNLYIAFRLTGLSGSEAGAKTNFITYSFRRAWTEDLSELIIQAVYENELGPVLHVVCKPNGSLWVERKMDPRQYADPWQPIQGANVRYAATVDGPDWRGEVAIPWQAITADPQRGRPRLVRFNFTQHKTLTGESASWAGPIDFGRDEDFTGVLILRDPQNPGMPGN